MALPTNTNNRGNYNWVPVATCVPPSMATPEGEKGEEYHDLWARYFLSEQNSSWVNYYRGNYVTNMEYAIDSRWGEEADVRLFLGDGAAQTSRIPFKFPIISPMLTRMVGAVDNISISAEAKPVTQYYAQTRKEEELSRVMLMSEAAATGPMMAGVYSDMGISPDKNESEQFFDMTYQDHIIRGANSLMNMIAERSKLDETKRTAAAHMAMSGLSAAHCFVNGNNLEWEICDPLEVGFDQSAMRPDASDGRYMYLCPLMDVPAIGERWNPKEGVIRALDEWARILPNGTNFNQGWPQSRPRVFTVYWKDMKYVHRGFVDIDGEPTYVTINEPDPDTGEPKYTDKDLIDPPVNQYTLAWTESERMAKKQRRCITVIRYCSLIPWEYLPGGYTKNRAWKDSGKQPRVPVNKGLSDPGVRGDIVLEYGCYPLQEADPDDVYSVKFPLKISMWRYIGGHVVAPLTAAIDPQRWMNQITSDIAWRVRKAGGRSVLIAAEALVGTNLDEQDVENKVKEGDTMVVSAQMLGGIQNSTSVIDASPGPEVYQLLGMLPQVKGVAESAIGVYEANYGAPGSSGQLVGTLELQLQQAGVMQQPFYAAIADMYRQIHQFNVQAGKQFYSRRPWLLSQMVVEEDMAALIASADMQLEQFRSTVDLAPDGAQLRLITDEKVIPSLMQMGMLDPVTAAQLMGRAIPQDAYAAARQFTKQAAMAQQAAQEQQAQAQQQAALTEEQRAIDEQSSELSKAEIASEDKLRQIAQKENQPLIQAEADWQKPDAVLGPAMGPM